jgi:hypothetical protein
LLRRAAPGGTESLSLTSGSFVESPGSLVESPGSLVESVGSIVGSAGSFAGTCRGIRDISRPMSQIPRHHDRLCRSFRDILRFAVADSATTRAELLHEMRRSGLPRADSPPPRPACRDCHKLS